MSHVTTGTSFKWEFHLLIYKGGNIIQKFQSMQMSSKLKQQSTKSSIIVNNSVLAVIQEDPSGYSHKCLRQNWINLGHFGPRGWGSDGQNIQLGWCKSDPGSDKEAHQRMGVRSMFGQGPGPLAERIFFLTSCGSCETPWSGKCLLNRGNAW